MKVYELPYELAGRSRFADWITERLIRLAELTEKLELERKLKEDEIREMHKILLSLHAFLSDHFLAVFPEGEAALKVLEIYRRDPEEYAKNFECVIIYDYTTSSAGTISEKKFSSWKEFEEFRQKISSPSMWGGTPIKKEEWRIYLAPEFLKKLAYGFILAAKEVGLLDIPRRPRAWSIDVERIQYLLEKNVRVILDEES